jgi:molybdate transport system substrate-binding protein
MPPQIKILSAGAVKPGLTKVIDAFRRDNPSDLKVTFATAPAILEQLDGRGEAVDIVVAPRNVLDQLAKTGKIPAAGRATLGKIGVGVMVREDASLPGIADVDAFRDSLLNAESIVYNQASTGIYLEMLFDRLGIYAEVRAKSTRYPDFAAVLDHVSKGKGREIGLGATTVIIENEKVGVKFAGPLPEEIQNYTAYAAAVTGGSEAGELAQQFIRYLSSSAARSLLSGAGIQ